MKPRIKLTHEAIRDAIYEIRSIPMGAMIMNAKMTSHNEYIKTLREAVIHNTALNYLKLLYEDSVGNKCVY